MGGRLTALTILGLLAFAPAARAEDFSIQHPFTGTPAATAVGSVTFPDAGGAHVVVTVTDRLPDGACAEAWVTSNLPPDTHKVYGACGAAQQKTYTFDLPGGARCNVAFVEIQVGTIDHSNDDKTAIGQAKRIDNPCPPVTVPAPPPPPPPPARITSTIDYGWTWFRRYTVVERLIARDVPEGATVQVRCRGKGCPRRARTVAVKRGKANLRKVLRRRHLRPGVKVEVRVTRADMIGKVLRFKMRRHRRPAMTRLCLPVGATKPTRCS
jgi:hypothetical protein